MVKLRDIILFPIAIIFGIIAVVVLTMIYLWGWLVNIRGDVFNNWREQCH